MMNVLPGNDGTLLCDVMEMGEACQRHKVVCLLKSLDVIPSGLLHDKWRGGASNIMLGHGGSWHGLGIRPLGIVKDSNVSLQRRKI